MGTLRYSLSEERRQFGEESKRELKGNREIIDRGRKEGRSEQRVKKKKRSEQEEEGMWPILLPLSSLIVSSLAPPPRTGGEGCMTGRVEDQSK